MKNRLLIYWYWKSIGHTDSVVAVGFNINGQYAATGGMDGIIKIWDSDTGKLVMNLDGPTEINVNIFYNSNLFI